MHHDDFLQGMSQHNNSMYNIRRLNKTTSTLIGLISLLSTISCYAGEDSTQAVYIKADEMFFDLQSNTSVYRGNVTIKKGTIELSGNHVEVQQSNNTVSKIVATGTPARFRQSSTDGSIMQAQSNHIKYFADEEKLFLIDEAKLIQNGQVMESNYISYDTKERALIAGKKSSQSGSNQLNPSQRVKMTLTPNTKK